MISQWILGWCVCVCCDRMKCKHTVRAEDFSALTYEQKKVIVKACRSIDKELVGRYSNQSLDRWFKRHCIVYQRAKVSAHLSLIWVTYCQWDISEAQNAVLFRFERKNTFKCYWHSFSLNLFYRFPLFLRASLSTTRLVYSAIHARQQYDSIRKRNIGNNCYIHTRAYESRQERTKAQKHL